MKILILSTKLPYPPKDGGAIATLSLAEGLAGQGNEIALLSLNTNKHSFNIDNIEHSLKEKIQFFAVDHNTDIHFPKILLNYYFSNKPYNAERFKSTIFLEKLAQLLLEFKPDLIQMEGPYLYYCIPLIRKHPGIRIAFRAHNVENEIWKRKAGAARNPLLKLYFNTLARRIRLLEAQMLKASDLLVAISDQDRRGLLEMHELTSMTIPAGLDPKKYPAPGPPLFPSLFFIGALDWQPNIEALLWFLEKVYPKISGRDKGIPFHVAGRNAPSWLEKHLERWEKTGLTYHGEVDDASRFMNSYAVFVCPLVTGSGIRIKILEGMMMQRTVVSSSVAAKGLTITDGVNILIRDEPGEMAKVIMQLFDNREWYDEIAGNGRQFILENFNTFAIAKKLSDFYKTNRS